MGLGILESHHGHGQQVPGSAVVLESASLDNIVLVPTPSDSPNDPLNWPWWKKDAILLAISIALGLTGIQGVCLSVVTGQIAEELNIPILQAEYLSTYQFLAVGAACAASAIAARLWGKRPVYLVSAALELAAAVWNALGTSYGSLLGSRILYGIGCAAFESVGLATIGDLYFIHERGRRVSFYAFLGIMGSQLGPILGGYISDTYGWRTQLWMLTAYWSALLIFMFVACPETSYRRPRSLETDMASSKGNDNVSSIENRPSSSAEKNPMVEESADVPVEKPRSLAHELAPVQGWQTDHNVFKVTIRLLTMALYPIVWFTFIIIATWLGWFVGISVTLAQIFGSPPLSFSPSYLGYLNAFGAVGAICAIVWMHALSDRVARWLAKRNGNVHEPEFRLVMMVPAIITAVIGFALYGWYAGVVPYEHGISWVAASAIYGVIIFSLIVGESASYGYLLDAHRDISVEASVFAIMLRQFFTYGAGIFMPLWILHSGVSTTFYALAGLHGGLVTILTVLMYVFGKRVRGFMAAHSVVRAFNVDVYSPQDRT